MEEILALFKKIGYILTIMGIILIPAGVCAKMMMLTIPGIVALVLGLLTLWSLESMYK